MLEYRIQTIIQNILAGILRIYILATEGGVNAIKVPVARSGSAVVKAQFKQFLNDDVN